MQHRRIEVFCIFFYVMLLDLSVLKQLDAAFLIVNFSSMANHDYTDG